MAIQILDNITIEKVGLSISNLILTFQGSYRVNYTINNGQKVYSVNGTLLYYIDKTKNHIHAMNHSYVINEEQLNSNLLEYMYNMVKSRYINYINI
jgi:hypothetical protein